jgi:protein O-mannosyl-transferase
MARRTGAKQAKTTPMRPGGSPPASRPRAGRPEPRDPAWTRPALLIALGLVLLVVAIYLPVRDYPFLDLDDPQYVSENPNVANGLSWPSIRWAFTSIYASYWIPLLWLSHMLDVQLYGLDAGGHHVTNLLLHAVNSVLLFALLRRMTGTTYRSALVAALFAVHPLHVESVVWITERKDVLSTFFWFAATWTYVTYTRTPKLGTYLLTAALFAFGLMSKPMLVTLPFTLLLLDVWPLRRLELTGPWLSATERRRALQLLLEKAPLIAMAVVLSLVTYLAQKTTGAVADVGQIPVGLRLQNAVVSYLTYVAQTLWPTDLAPFYGYPTSLPSWKVLGSAALLTALTVLAVRSVRARPWLPVGWFWYLGTLVPVIGLIQAGTQARADRFTYVPLIGLFILIAWAIPELRGRKQLLTTAAAGIAVAACSLAARAQVALWQSKVSIWEHTLAVARESYEAHMNMGIARHEQGELAAAITQYREAIRLRPHGEEAHNNLGVALADSGDIDGAVQAFLDGLAANPAQAASHYNVAVLLAGKGDVAGAVEHLQSALRINPGYAEARQELERLSGGGEAR